MRVAVAGAHGQVARRLGRLLTARGGTVGGRGRHPRPPAGPREAAPVRVRVAGAHGPAARRLGRLLTARGDTVVGIVRNPAHTADLEADGVTPAVPDLEPAPAAEVAPEHPAHAGAA